MQHWFDDILLIKTFCYNIIRCPHLKKKKKCRLCVIDGDYLYSLYVLYMYIYVIVVFKTLYMIQTQLEGPR